VRLAWRSDTPDAAKIKGVISVFQREGCANVLMTQRGFWYCCFVLTGPRTELPAQGSGVTKGTQAMSLLLSQAELARLLNISSRTISRMNASGKIPKPVRVGRSVLWRREEIERWIEVGCPIVADGTRKTSRRKTGRNVIQDMTGVTQRDLPRHSRDKPP